MNKAVPHRTGRVDSVRTLSYSPSHTGGVPLVHPPIIRYVATMLRYSEYIAHGLRGFREYKLVTSYLVWGCLKNFSTRSGNRLNEPHLIGWGCSSLLSVALIDPYRMVEPHCCGIMRNLPGREAPSLTAKGHCYYNSAAAKSKTRISIPSSKRLPEVHQSLKTLRA